MLEIKNLFVKIGDKEILKNLSINIYSGQKHVIMGPNGAGKSTLSKVLLNAPFYEKSGKILYKEVDITNEDTDVIAQKKFFLLNQLPPAIEGVTNFDLLKAAVKKRDEKFDLYEFNKKLEKICEYLEYPVSYLHREVNVGFSGGERKKNELLHMWMLEPEFIILDEIDSGLDVDALKIVIKSINKYIEKYNPAILMITHRTDILNEIKPDYVHVLKNGKLVVSGGVEIFKKIQKEGYNWTNEMIGQ